MSTLIFGILNIAFGLYGLVVAPLLMLAGSKIQSAAAKSNANSPFLAMQTDPNFIAMTKYKTELGLVMGAALVTFGIGLLLLKNWARLGSIIYAFIDIVVVLVMVMVSWPITTKMIAQMPNVSPGMAQSFAMIGLVFQLIFGMAYPVLLLIFMTRDNVIEACQPEQEAPTPPPQAA